MCVVHVFHCWVCAGAVRYTLPLLEGSAGFVKALLPWQWGLWVMSINGLRLLAAREAWEAAQQKVGVTRVTVQLPDGKAKDKRERTHAGLV